MKTAIRYPVQSFHLRLLSLVLFAASFMATPVAFADNADTGSLTGQVANSTTHQYLKGAVVSLPKLARQTVTDEVGRYTFIHLPAGTQEVEAAYLGLDTVDLPVQVVAGQRATLDLNLTSTVYQLSALQVNGMREGSAEAITTQRSAPSVVTVQALDALGSLPNDNAGEMLVRMPGVAASLDAENNVQGVVIRGAPPGLNTVSVDGDLVPGPGGMGRNFQTHSISGSLFDQIEVIKAPTPDMSADSLGGAVIFKTRDPLSLQDDSEIAYRIADRWAPPFFDETPYRRKHSSQPLLSFGAEEVFSVLGGERNLGVSLSAFYSENAAGYHTTNLDNQFTLTSPAYNYEYQTVDGYNNRKQTSVDAKVEYRVSAHTTISFNTFYNDAFEPYNPIYTMTASTGRTLAALGANGLPTATNTGGIAPGFTDSATTVLPVPSSQVQLNSTQYSSIDRQRLYDLRGRTDFDRWHFNYNANYNYADVNQGNGWANGNWSGGIFTMAVPGVGWNFDRSGSNFYPQFSPNAGPSIANGANYTNGLMVIRRLQRYATVYTGAADATYDLPTAFTSSIETGVRYTNERWYNRADNHEWNYTGAAPLSALVDPGIRTQDEARSGISLPFVDSSYVAQNIEYNPGNWTQNQYYHQTQFYTGTASVIEGISSAFVQGHARIGQLDLLTGVRMEHTEDIGKGFVQAKVLSTAAQQAADPIGSANADYDHPATVKGAYTDFFPGIYATYHFTKNLQSRLDYSNSIGRPTAADLVPTQTANNTTDTLTIANPTLKPQFARNFDVDLEYYFEPVGELSVGWFQKDIRDYIVSANVGTIGFGADNGYQGDYGGYTLISNTNGGTATVAGWEFAYQQQFTFLPGVLKGLGLFANYTQLQTHGNYGGTGVIGTNAVAGFVPKTGNLGLTYNYRGFGMRLLANYTGRYLNTASTSLGRNLFRYSRTIANLGLSYRLNRAATLNVDFTNLFNEPQSEYWGDPRYFAQGNYTYATVTTSISGKF